jgi:hypothetical protein
LIKDPPTRTQHRNRTDPSTAHRPPTTPRHHPHQHIDAAETRRQPDEHTRAAVVPAHTHLKVSKYHPRTSARSSPPHVHRPRGKNHGSSLGLGLGLRKLAYITKKYSCVLALVITCLLQFVSSYKAGPRSQVLYLCYERTDRPRDRTPIAHPPHPVHRAASPGEVGAVR